MAWQFDIDAFGRAIQSKRKLEGITLRQLACRTGVSNAFLCQVEAGGHKPGIDVVVAICEWLGLGPEAFIIRPPEPLAALDLRPVCGATCRVNHRKPEDPDQRELRCYCARPTGHDGPHDWRDCNKSLPSQDPDILRPFGFKKGS